MQQYAALLMLALLALGLTLPTSLYASTSSDEEEEDEETNGGDSSTTEEGSIPPVPPAPSAPTPIAPPASSAEAGSGAAEVAVQKENAPLTVDQLMEKYGANQTRITVPQNVLQDMGSKAVILTFDDNWQSQHDYAMPILERNGMNATFFVYCLGIGQGPGFMNTSEVIDLHNRGFDIQSHSMTHQDLMNATEKQLQYEIATSKQCLQDMVPGLNVTTFATPYATGAENATILTEIEKAGYEMGRAGYGGSFFLGCDGWYVTDGNQTKGCELFEQDGQKLKIQNRFNIPVSDINGLGRENNFSLPAVQQAFIKELNEAIGYDQSGKLNQVPVLVYHNFSNRVLPPDQMGQSLLAESFAQEMKYLHDNNFVVLSMADLKYNPGNATFTIPKLRQ